MSTSRYEHPSATPITLLVPDMGESGDYWQDHWRNGRIDCLSVDPGTAEHPDRNNWVARLDAALHRIDAPVMLVGHGVGALAIAAWAELLGQEVEAQIAGALLVAPRDPLHPANDERLASFTPLPAKILPFPSLVVASDDDAFLSSDRAFSLARQWGAGFARFDGCGDFHAIGRWPEGEELLDRFIDLVEPGTTDTRAGIDALSQPASAAPVLDRANPFRL